MKFGEKIAQLLSSRRQTKRQSQKVVHNDMLDLKIKPADALDRSNWKAKI